MQTKRERRTRRVHGAQFKAAVLEQCKAAGASVAAVAQANGVDASLVVSVWRRHLDSAAGRGEDARAALEWERSEAGGFSRSSWLPAMGQQFVDA